MHDRRRRHAVSHPRHQGRGGLLVVRRPLPDHLLADGLLPRRARHPLGRLRALRARGGQRHALLRLDPAARARPRLRRQAPRHRGLRDHALDVRRLRAAREGLGHARDRVQDRDRGPAGHRRDRRRLRGRRAGARGRPRVPSRRTRPGRHADLRDRRPGELARQHQPPRPDLQPGSRLPAGRGTHRPGDRLVADRQPQQRHPVRRHPRRVVRALPDPRGARLLHGLPGRPHRRHLARLRRLHPPRAQPRRRSRRPT